MLEGELVMDPNIGWAEPDAVDPKLDREFRWTIPGMPNELGFVGRVEERAGVELTDELGFPVWLRAGDTTGELPNRGKSKRKLSLMPIEFLTAVAGAAEATAGRPPWALVLDSFF